MKVHFNSKQRFLEIDYIKVFMMIFIVITHINYSDAQRNNYLFNFYIDLAVPVLMIISGFMYAISISKLKKWFDWYNPRYLIKRLYRFLFPFFVLITIEYLMINFNSINIIDYVYFLIIGGYGPGSYYTPVMVQFILCFPVLFKIFYSYKNNKNIVNVQGLIVLFLLDIVFNTLSTNLNLSASLYRLSYFRYIGFTGMGIFIFDLYKNKEKLILKTFMLSKDKKVKINVLLLLLTIISYLFLTGVTFNVYNPVIFTKWKTTSLPTMAASILLFLDLCIIIRYFVNKYNLGKLNSLIITISRSTFHIYLVQMVFYQFVINNYIPFAIQPIINTFICILFGVLFYLSEVYFHNILQKFKRIILKR